MRIGAIGYAVAQGLGHLMRDFVRAGVVTHPIVWPHRARQNHPEWYEGKVRSCSVVSPEAGSLAKFIRQNGKRYFDVLLAFETFFDWSAIDACREAGIKTVLVPMHEWFPKTPPAVPDLFVCPSKLDYRYFNVSWSHTNPAVPVGGWSRDARGWCSSFLPIPVDPTTWRPRTRALRWLHNAGNVGHRWHKGTLELLKAIPLVKNPDFRITVRAQDQRELAKVIAEAGAAAKDSRITYQMGEVPYAGLWDGFDVYIAPEKFNGLSLPLQEARAAGLLVVTSDRFPHNDWLPRWPLIPVSGYHRACVGSSYLEFDEAEVLPEDIAAWIDMAHGQDISTYSERGREWAEAHSWAALRAKWLEVLAP